MRRSLPPRLHRDVLLRRSALVVVDGLLIVAAFLEAFALRLQERETLLQVLDQHLHLLPLALLSGLPILVLSGWYRGLTRYAGSHSLYGLVPRAGLMVLVLLLISTLLGGDQPPRSFWILYWLLFTGGAIASRILLRDLLLQQLERNQGPGEPGIDPAGVPTLIYGAGSTGSSLAQALRSSPQVRLVGFVDDDPRLHGRTIQTLTIASPPSLPGLIERHRVRQVLLALPSIGRSRKRQLVDELTHLGLRVLSIPSLSQLANGRQTVSDLQPVAIEDLLGRESSSPDPALLSRAVKDQAVLVTGAGGSIGSELCRQILEQGAHTLVLLERHEFALYAIEKELIGQVSSPPGQAARPLLVPVIGDAADGAHLTSLCKRHRIDTLFHAAAYKHVPMVEANLCAGVANNLRSTRAVINTAFGSQVKRVMLISTDKAVRPTNAMGASKRICELLIQAASSRVAAEAPAGPVFAMVRFGNVLGSSGSVIPLFHEQIARGGPVTVTHPAITRYFMTIPEAVQLVLQATGMATGGDLFLLDMGDPVRIADLARQMIELSGLRVRDARNPDGDIAIQFTGLRPGEKLYEELLIEPGHSATAHPLIRRASEPLQPAERLLPLVERLERALEAWDDEEAARLLHELVPEYRRGASASEPPLPGSSGESG
jgi:nucleoside-diphosphate-sugar epimerase